MVSAIIRIVLGVIIWKIVPSWITEGEKARDIIKLACNIIGIIMILSGSYSLLMSFIGH